MKKNLVNLARTYPLMLQMDEKGTYILYCNYQCHRGVVIPKQRITCEEKDCIHMIKFRDERYSI